MLNNKCLALQHLISATERPFFETTTMGVGLIGTSLVKIHTIKIVVSKTRSSNLSEDFQINLFGRFLFFF